VARADVDEVSGRLWGSGLVAVVVEHVVDDAMVDLRIGLIDGAEAVAVAALVEALSSRWTVDVVDDGEERSAVAAALRSSATVIRAGERLVVVPPWWAYESADGEVVLAIDPGSAFGSGTHVTTRMALAALERLDVAGRRVLDIGSGTGVLSVASARLGARRVLAIEVDPDAARTTEANAAANAVGDVVAVVVGDAVDVASVAPGPFDVVVANLSAGSLISVASSLPMVLAPQGVAVLTGIVSERLVEVVDQLRSLGAASVDEQSIDGWSLILCRFGQSGAEPGR
jgi:ribosomal protein L11 methyltransferase